MKDPVDMLWQDKEIRFDNKFEQLELRRGEFLIDTMSKIEDTKGNNGDNGDLQVCLFLTRNPCLLSSVVL